MQKLIERKKMNKKQGFSLIEVIITMAILSVGIGSISLLMANNIKNVNNSRDQIIASSLAQEGVELVRNLKDNKKLNQPPLDKCSTNPCPIYTAVIDSQNPATVATLAPAAAPSDYLLNLNNNNFFVHNNPSGKATKFKRAIITQLNQNSDINPTGDGKTPSTRIMTVVSKVWWSDNQSTPPDDSDCKVGNKCIEITSVMPDYQ